jgi:hypothetical protein
MVGEMVDGGYWEMVENGEGDTGIVGERIKGDGKSLGGLG